MVALTKDFGEAQDEVFNYFKCLGCGIVLLLERPEEKDLGKYYRSDYQPYSSRYNFLTEKFISHRTKKEARLFKKWNKGARRLLDVGCSFGKYMKDMRDYGKFSVVGVELSGEMSDFGREKFGLDIRQGNLLEQNFDNCSFDIVVLSHVIEHLYNPKEIVEEIYRILSPSGLVFIKTPNIDTFERSIFGRYWLPFEAPRHTFLFNKQTLRFLLGDAFAIRNVVYEKTPNNIILSIKNYFVDKKYPQSVVNFFNLNNYFLLGIFTPIAFLLGLLKTSGRIVILAQKQ